MMMGDYDKLPEHMRGAARRYVEEGRAPGDFLMAVLTNNLVRSFSQADDENRARITDWINWLYDDVPMDAWGSPGKVSKWMLARRAEAMGGRSAEVFGRVSVCCGAPEYPDAEDVCGACREHTGFERGEVIA